LEPLFIGVKQLEHEADHSLPSNAKVKNESSERERHTHTHTSIWFQTLCMRRIEVL